MSSILIIDDEDSYLELCRRHMPEHSFLPPARNYREAVELLRAARRLDAAEAEREEVELATCDPLNLVGIITAGPRVPAVRGHVLRYRDGEVVGATVAQLAG